MYKSKQNTGKDGYWGDDSVVTEFAAQALISHKPSAKRGRDRTDPHRSKGKLQVQSKTASGKKVKAGEMASKICWPGFDSPLPDAQSGKRQTHT